MTKKEMWDYYIGLLAQMTDGLGKEVDENIKETIVAFNLNGIPTSSSCGGHIGEYFSFPYIQGRAEGEPEYRYEGEDVIIRGLVEKHNLNDKRDVFDGGVVEQEFYNLTDGREETSEYKEWHKGNSQLRSRVQEMIIQSGITSIYLLPIYPGYRVEAHREKGLTRKLEIENAIKDSQEEFRKLTEFLKGKYFS